MKVLAKALRRRPIYSDGKSLYGCVCLCDFDPVSKPMAIVSETAMVGTVRLEITRFTTNARVVLLDGAGLGLGLQIIAWERQSDEAVALVQSVIRGDCPAGILADYMDEHPYLKSPISGPKAVQLLRNHSETS
jgi:hypothetical protein